MFEVKTTGQLISHKGRTFRDKIDYGLFPARKCVKCNGDILTSDTAHIIEDGKSITVECKLDYKDYRSVVCWGCRPPHSMNPNSIEYNVIKFGLSEAAARDLIHTRNKSPFYKSNHVDYDAYRQFQAHSNFTDEKNAEIRIKQNQGRERWANRIGKEKVKEIKDSSSLRHHIEKYGEELGRMKFQEKNNKCRGLTKTEITTKDQMSIHLSVQYSINNEEDLKTWFRKKTKFKSIMSVLYIIENDTVLNRHTVPIQFGKIVFNIENLYDFFGVLHIKEFIEKRVRPNNKGYTYNAIVDGFFLRSGREITFYKLLDQSNIKVVDTNKSYPGAGRNFYDFLIEVCGVMYYIEIVGSETIEYKQKLQDREKNFGSILIEPKYYKKFLDDASQNSIQQGKYNDW